jgi:hypothetical protein
MAMQNLVSATLSAEASEEILDHLGAIKKRLDFLTSLGREEIQGLVKAGKTYAPLLDKAYGAMTSHPEIMSSVFPAEEFRKDYQLYKDLAPIARQVEELHESLQKTMMALSSDTMVETLEIYGAVKQNANKVPGLKVVADEMASFFPRSKRKEGGAKG